MRYGRFILLLTLLALVVLALSACAPRVGADVEASPASENLTVDMPALIIDFDTQGTAMIGSVPVAEIGAAFGQDLGALQLTPETVQRLMEGNIQHIQVANTPAGLAILVNGKPIPSFSWDAESLIATVDLAQAAGADLGAVGDLVPQLAPALQGLGLGVVIKLPLAEGAEPIPLAIEEESVVAAESLAARDDFLETVGAQPLVRLMVSYDDEGVASLAGISANDMEALAGLNMEPDQLAALREAGLEQITLSTTANGLFVTLNDRALPHISWASGEVNNLIDVIAQTGMLDDTLEANNMDPDAVLQLIDVFLPMIQATDLNVVVSL